MREADSTTVVAPQRSIIVLAKYCEGGRNLEETISGANHAKVILVPNRDFDKYLMDNDQRALKGAGPARSGTGAFFGENQDGFIVDNASPLTWRLRIPREHLAAWSESSVIIAEHGFINGKPIIEIEQDGNNRIVHLEESSIVVVHGKFPSKNGWYPTNAFGIPLTSTEENHGERYLWRSGVHIDLCCPGYYRLYNYHLDVYAANVPSDRLGVLAYENQDAAAETQTPAAPQGEKR